MQNSKSQNNNSKETSPCQKYVNQISERLDTHRNDHEFCGWTPCLAGQLCFDFAEVGLNSSSLKFNPFNFSYIKDYYFNQALERNEEKYIVISSVHDWRDNLNADGNFRIIMIGKTENSCEEFKGKVYIVPFSQTKKNEHANFKVRILKKLEELKDFNEEIDNLKSRLTEDIEIARKQAQSKNTFENLERELEKLRSEEPELYLTDFVLDCSGLTFLTYQERNKFQKELDDSKTTYKTISRQSFYYIKYAFHKHKHHPIVEDSITSVHELKQLSKFELARTLIKELRIAVVDIKRGAIARKPIDIIRTNHFVMGINEYAKSLTESLHKYLFIEKEFYERKIKYLNNMNNMNNSYSVFIDGVKTKAIEMNAYKQRTLSWTAILLAVLSITIYMAYRLLLSKDEEGSSKELIEVFTLSKEQLMLSTLSLLFVLLAFLIIRYFTLKNLLLNSAAFRWIKRNNIFWILVSFVLAILFYKNSMNLYNLINSFTTQ